MSPHSATAARSKAVRYLLARSAAALAAFSAAAAAVFCAIGSGAPGFCAAGFGRETAGTGASADAGAAKTVREGMADVVTLLPTSLIQEFKTTAAHTTIATAAHIRISKRRPWVRM